MAPNTRRGAKRRIATTPPKGASHGAGTSFTAENYPPTIPQSLEYHSRTFEDAARAIDCRTSEKASEGAPFGSQTGDVEVWANEHGKLIPDHYFHGLEVVSDCTSEHKVYLRQSDRRAVKKTWAGVYGQVPVPRDGKLDRTNASPVEYLRRMSLQINVFGSDLRLEGVHISEEPSMIVGQPARQPSFVISQSWLDKAGTATNESISAYLTEEKFREVPGSYFGWYRPADGVVIVDAKPDNFIKTAAGLVPIDLQMAVFGEKQVIEAGLSDLKNQSAAGTLIILP